jgi:cytochrome c biogenesis protein CcmG, thiol:disulfide interchange protein DsbE
MSRVRRAGTICGVLRARLLTASWGSRMMETDDRRVARGRSRLLVVATACAGIVAAAGIVWIRGELAPAARLLPFLPPSAPGQSSPGGAFRMAGRRAPDFSLPILSGGPAGPGGRLTLHELRGRPVVLNFWASWCAPCRAETPLLVRLNRVYGPRGVVIIGIDSEDEIADARLFLGQYHVDYTVVGSPDEKLMASYAIPGLPTTVFIGPDGVIRDREVGGFIGPDGEKALTVKLERLLRPSP